MGSSASTYARTTNVSDDPYYRTAEWLKLRQARLWLDHHVCVVPGCGARATNGEHVLSRKAGGADALHNLRSLCKQDDQMVQERNGKRLSKGLLITRGCHADGSPRDPRSPWYKT